MSNSTNNGTYIFNDLTPGEHLVGVRDVNGCGESFIVLTIIDYPKYFTPNGDGYHDTWNIFGLKNQPDAKIHIYNRYGKLLKQLSPIGKGWDGIYNGNPLFTNDYWFSVEYIEQTTGENTIFKAHFTLKR